MNILFSEHFYLFGRIIHNFFFKFKSVLNNKKLKSVDFFFNFPTFYFFLLFFFLIEKNQGVKFLQLFDTSFQKFSFNRDGIGGGIYMSVYHSVRYYAHGTLQQPGSFETMLAGATAGTHT